MAVLPLINGWEIGFSQDVIVATLERCDPATNTCFDVELAADAVEASRYVRAELDGITTHWEGTEHELAFITSFAFRYEGGY